MKPYQFAAIMSVLFFIWADAGGDVMTASWPHRANIFIRFCGGLYFAFKFGGEMRRERNLVKQQISDITMRSKHTFINKDGSTSRE